MSEQTINVTGAEKLVGVVTQLDRVGKRAYALVQPLVKDGVAWIVTGMPANIREGSLVEVLAIPSGRRHIAFQTTLVNASTLAATATEAEARVMGAAERQAFAQSRAQQSLSAQLDTATVPVSV